MIFRFPQTISLVLDELISRFDEDMSLFFMEKLNLKIHYKEDEEKYNEELGLFLNDFDVWWTTHRCDEDLGLF